VLGGKKPKLTVEEAIMLCRWAFYGQDFHARHVRGEASDDQQVNEYLRPSSVYKPSKLGDKLAKARIFIEERARRAAERGPVVEQGRTEPERPAYDPNNPGEPVLTEAEIKLRKLLAAQGPSSRIAALRDARLQAMGAEATDA
jgi:hypothetical protein